jgi:hypothetical protein
VYSKSLFSILQNQGLTSNKDLCNILQISVSPYKLRIFMAGFSPGRPRVAVALDGPRKEEVLTEVKGIQIAIDPVIERQRTRSKSQRHCRPIDRLHG